MKFLTKDELATVCGSRELVRRIYKVALVTMTLLDVYNLLSMDMVLEQLTKGSYSLLCSEKLEGEDYSAVLLGTSSKQSHQLLFQSCSINLGDSHFDMKLSFLKAMQDHICPEVNAVLSIVDTWAIKYDAYSWIIEENTRICL